MQVIFLTRIKRFLINGFITSFIALLINTISIFFNIYISNRVGTEAIGAFSLLMSVYALAITISSSGVNISTIKIISEKQANNLSIDFKKTSKQCLKFACFLGICACILFISLAKVISTYWLHNKVSHYTIYFISIALPFISMSSCINGYFCAIRKMYKSASAQVIETITKIFAIIFLLNMWGSRGLEFVCLSLIVGDFLSEVISFAYLYIIYLFDVNKLSTPRFDKNCTKRFFSICTPVAITSYIKSGLSTLKHMLIPVKLEKSGLSCSEALSKYGMIGGMAMPIFMFPSVFINSFSNLLVPEITLFYEKKNYYKINKSISIVFKIALSFAFCVFGVFALFSEQIGIAIYNNAEVGIYLKLLCPIVLFIYLDGIVDSILKGLNKQVGIMLCNILDSIVSISFICILLPNKGILGYIIVIFISEILNLSISLLQLKKATNFKFDYLNWILFPALSVFFATFVAKALNIAHNNTYYSLISHIGMFIVCYLITYISLQFLKKFNPSLKRLLKKIQ